MNNDIDQYHAGNTSATSSDDHQEEDYSGEWWRYRQYHDKDGLEFNAVGVILMAVGIFFLFQDQERLIFITCLAINVLLHECGHYAAGRAFKCVVRKVAVFFFPAITYKDRATSFYDPATHSWRDTVWTLGVLPFGGYTSFENATTPAPADSSRSPFVNHKPAWQRLIIHTAGILVNLATFLVCFAINGFSFINPANPWISYMAYMSLALSILNILPLYPLDGSAAITTIYEMITGRKPPKAFMTVFIVIGAVLFIYLFWINPTFLNKLISLIMGQ